MVSTKEREHYFMPRERAKYPRVLAVLLRWLQGLCHHNAMKADILEGDCRDYGVRWCETCGAVWRVRADGVSVGGIRRCEPTWER